MTPHTKDLIDWLSLGTALATFLKWLPAIAALMSIIWTGIRIYEWWKGKTNGNQQLDRLDS